MNESRQSLHQGALNLYQRTALAPYGDINPNLQGFNYFAPDGAVTWGDSVRPLLRVGQGVGGVAQMAGGILAAPVTLGGSLAITARGLDDFQAASRSLWTGSDVSTITNWSATSAARALGASEGVASTVGFVTELGTGLASPGAAGAILAKSGGIVRSVSGINAGGRYIATSGANFASRSWSATADFATGFARSFNASARNSATLGMNGGNLLRQTLDAISDGVKNLRASAKGGQNGLHVLDSSFTPNETALRKVMAFEFYTNEAGLSARSALQHMRGIDFTKPLRIVDVPYGTTAQQFVEIGGKPGRYFASINATPLEIGVDSVGRIPTLFQSAGRVRALESTASNFVWPHGPTPGAGGGVQYFIPQNHRLIPITR